MRGNVCAEGEVAGCSRRKGLPSREHGEGLHAGDWSHLEPAAVEGKGNVSRKGVRRGLGLAYCAKGNKDLQEPGDH